MQLGIALGGLTKGLGEGQKIGEKFAEDYRQGELNRGIGDAVQGANDQFDQQVAAGTAKESDRGANIMRLAAPRLVAPLLKAQKFGEAAHAAEWVQKDSTKNAADAWGAGMVALNAGDVKTGIDKFGQAANRYGLNLKFGEPTQGEDGSWSVPGTVNGKTVTKVFKSPAEIAQFGAMVLNPQGAYKAIQDQQADTAKHAARKDVDLFYKQKEQELGLGTPGFETQNVVGTDAEGKPKVTPYVFDRRRGTAAPMTDNEGNPIDGQVTKPGRGGGSNGSGQTERLASALIEEAAKQGKALSLADAIAITKRAPNGDMLTMRKEGLAQGAAKADSAFGSDPVGTLEKYRRGYGLPPLVPPAEVPKNPQSPGFMNWLFGSPAAPAQAPAQTSPQQQPGITQPGAPPQRQPSAQPQAPAQQGAAANPPAPRDAAQRKVGQTYVAPDGRNIQWTGKGWLVVP